ncbi:MAG: hypothetical protein GTN80_05030 [Nitrososphaeria archaeon]|nr:hypothetical protein [Nitrososphaeria archaeon]NIQ32989.1 hypothetical protein [Nitrososphaeria archaeon]
MSSEVSPKLYKMIRDKVLKHSLAVQRYDGQRYRPRPLTDKEIAERLDITETQAKEIRCIAEIDLMPPDVWETAEEYKEERRRSGEA